MPNVPRLFLFTTAMIPLHIVEQLVFGIDERLAGTQRQPSQRG